MACDPASNDGELFTSIFVLIEQRVYFVKGVISFTSVNFFAYWDDCEQFKIRFAKICRFHNIRYHFVDCETPSGVAESIRRGVKLCPAVIVLDNGAEVYRCKGNNAFHELDVLFNEYEDRSK